MTAALLRPVPVPSAFALVPGGTRHRPLELSPPPRVALASTDRIAALELLRYGGVRYASPHAPAASIGIRVFAAGRALALRGPYDAVTLDWDHTLSNYQIFEDLVPLLRVRRSASPPSAGDASAVMAGIEIARPFMIELTLGMMVGFALRQGLSRLSDWGRYEPQVGIATHTWPDRLGRLATHYMPILPLMEGLLPGAPDTYERFTSADVRSVIHLHHFLGYATALVRRFDGHGFAGLAPVERHELMRYVEDGAAHRRKPLGAWGARGWDPVRLLHIDDSSTIVADLTRQAALAGHAGARFRNAPHPHSRTFRNVQEWHKVSLPALWRSRTAAIRGAVAHLVRAEARHSPVPELLRGLGRHADAAAIGPLSELPAGTVLTIHETPTTLGELWDYYVEPTAAARSLIRAVSRRHGGRSTIRQAYRDGLPGPGAAVAPAPRVRQPA